MSTPDYSWVTIARFFSPNEALFFKNILEGHDIPAFVPNEYMGHLDIRLVRAEGGVQLKVPSDRADEARALLEAPPELDAEYDEDLDEEYDEDFNEEDDEGLDGEGNEGG